MNSRQKAAMLALTVACAVLWAACSKKPTTPNDPNTPRLAAIGSQFILVGDSLGIRITATDPNGDSIILSIQNAPVNFPFTDHGDGTGLWSLVPDSSQSGTYSVLVTASDGTHTDSETVIVRVGVDLSGFFVLPGPGYDKFFTGGEERVYVKDTVVEGHSVVDVALASGEHEYFRTSDRAWVAWWTSPPHDSTFFLLQPPLAAVPDTLVVDERRTAPSSLPLQSGALPVKRITELKSTALSLTVPAGSFDSVILIRQEFWIIGETQGAPDTSVDSAYRWFAPGVDEIRQVRWRDGQPDSTLRDFIGGTVGGNTYP
jgi:hypothetical protein